MKILSIQSAVAYGHVGNSAAVFPLQRIGVEVMPVYTVNFSNHTGYGAWRGPLIDPADVREVITGIEERGALATTDAVLSGYQGGEGIAGADFFFVGEILVYLFHRGNLRGEIRHFQVLGDGRDRQVGCVGHHGRHSDSAEGGDGEQHGGRADNTCLACRRQLCVQA